MGYYDMVKFERGQVWVIRFKHKESVGREQAKDRPWVILSIGKFNSSSGMITCAPITTRDKVVTPAQVMFYNTDGQRNVVLCEQIRTFDYKSGEYILDYMGRLSDDVMEKVDVALSIHLGMHYSPITLKSLYDNMEAIIKSVRHMESQKSKVFTDNDVSEFVEKMKSLAGTSLYTENSFIDEVAVTKIENIIDTPQGDETPNDPPQEEPAIETPKKSKRISWTVKTCEEFLHDAENKPMKEVMEKWGISKKTRFYSTKSYVRGLLMQKTDT